MKAIVVPVLALLLCACSGAQVKRDLDHAATSAAYREATTKGATLDAGTLCRDAPAPGTWVELEFAGDTPILAVAPGTNAAARCVAIPAGARGLEVRGQTSPGLTYYEIVAIQPSLLFLDATHAPLVDMVKPRLRAGEGFVRGLHVTGVVPLQGGLAAARYVVVYIHPESTDGSIDVFTGYEQIPVPFGPYGTVRVRFVN